MGEERLAALIRAHLARYPALEVADVYKLLYQATFGPGHAVVSKKAAREWLEQEAGKANLSLSEPLIVSVHPDGEIVRLQVRPYLLQGGQLKWLLDAFVRSSSAVHGDPALMAARWQVFVDLCQRGGPLAGEFSTREVRLFGMVRAAEHWPAVHHSPTYCAAYRPFYRVLLAEEAAALCDKLGVPFEVA